MNWERRLEIDIIILHRDGWTRLVGWQERDPVCKLCWKLLFWNEQRTESNGELGNWDSSGKFPFKCLCAHICDSDPDDPDFSRQMRRPVEVKEDVRRMEERQRVKRILQSRAFRDELEELVTELQTGAGLSSVLTVPRPLITAASHQSQTPSLIGRGKLTTAFLLASVV